MLPPIIMLVLRTSIPSALVFPPRLVGPFTSTVITPAGLCDKGNNSYLGDVIAASIANLLALRGTRSVEGSFNISYSNWSRSSTLLAFSSIVLFGKVNFVVVGFGIFTAKLFDCLFVETGERFPLFWACKLV